MTEVRKITVDSSPVVLARRQNDSLKLRKVNASFASHTNLADGGAVAEGGVARDRNCATPQLGANAYSDNGDVSTTMTDSMTPAEGHYYLAGQAFQSVVLEACATGKAMDPAE